MSTQDTPQAFEVSVGMSKLVCSWHHSTPSPQKANLVCLWPSQDMCQEQLCMHRLRGSQEGLTHIPPGLTDDTGWSELLLCQAALKKPRNKRQSIVQTLDGHLEERNLGPNIAQLKKGDFQSLQISWETQNSSNQHHRKTKCHPRAPWLRNDHSFFNESILWDRKETVLDVSTVPLHRLEAWKAACVNSWIHSAPNASVDKYEELCLNQQTEKAGGVIPTGPIQNAWNNFGPF